MGELFEFDRNNADGVFRSSVRAWFSFSHVCFALLFIFGHWWHATRSIYRDVFSGIDQNLNVEFGAFVKIGG